MSDVLLGCDIIVALRPGGAEDRAPGHTVAILNTDVAPTGDFQSNKHLDLGEGRMRSAIVKAIAGAPLFELNATKPGGPT